MMKLTVRSTFTLLTAAAAVAAVALSCRADPGVSTASPQEADSAVEDVASPRTDGAGGPEDVDATRSSDTETDADMLDASPDALGDGSTPPEKTCRLVDGGCVDCICFPERGFEADLTRRCAARVATVLACGGCGSLPGNSCTIVTDADGGEKVYQVPSPSIGEVRLGSQRPCDPALKHDVILFPDCSDADASDGG